MPGSFRKAAALIAVYAIALQALLTGFVVKAQASFDPFAVTCASGASGDTGVPAPSRHGNDCSLCPLACGGAAAALVPSSTVSFLRFAERPRLSAVWTQAPSIAARHQPHASRAPPV
jgi:hypothetical protein